MDGYLYMLLMIIPMSSAGDLLTGSSSHAMLGQSFRFTCTVTGSSTGSLLTFMRDNKEVCTVSLNPCQQFSAPRGYTCSCGQSGVYNMDITSVSQRDEGRWECKLSQTSNSITLPVYYGPFNNVAVDKPSPLTLTEDVTVSLTARCSADCNPACSYIWMKGTQQVSDNSDLPVGSFKRDQGGDYRCTARNTATGATADSQNLTVNVQYLERLQLKLDKVEAQGSASVTVTCTVESNPISEMTVENIDSEAQSTFGVTNNLTFTLDKTQCLQTMFRCTVKNSQTKTLISTTKEINVACSPRPDSSKQTDTIITGKIKATASLTADIIANPLPNFTWYHYQGTTQVPVVAGTDKVVLTKGLQSVLKVHIERDEDYGIYRVVVQNREGIISLFFSLTKDVSTPEAPSCNTLPVAVGEGTIIVILIVVIVFILYRRSLLKVLPGRYAVDGSCNIKTGLQRHGSIHGRAVDDPLPAETVDVYSGVHETAPGKQMDTELREFETNFDSSTQGCTAYEHLQVRTPQVYEDIKRATFVNGTETN